MHNPMRQRNLTKKKQNFFVTFYWVALDGEKSDKELLIAFGL